MSRAFTASQRVYYIWLSITNAIQQLNKHDGDQEWFTVRKGKLLDITGRNGREFDRRMSVEKMANDIIVMVIEETRGMLVSKIRKGSKAS